MGVVLAIAKVIYVIVCLLIVGSVLLQESKGGGLAGLGGTRAEAAFGASNPLRRLTVVLSIIFFVVAGLLSLTGRQTGQVEETKPEEPAATAPEEGEGGAKEEPASGSGTDAAGGGAESAPSEGGGPE